MSATGRATDLVETFVKTSLGQAPAGWVNVGMPHSLPTWAVDGRGLLRVQWKGETGLLVAKGANFGTAVVAEFEKTPDPEVFLGVAALQSEEDFYTARFSGDHELRLSHVAGGEETSLGTMPTLRRYREGERWRLRMDFSDKLITARLLDQDGVTQARVDAQREEGWQPKWGGLQASSFAGVASFVSAGATPRSDAPPAPARPDLVLRPVAKPEALDTDFSALAPAYDVVVGGAGTAGWAAAVQAARLGAKVLLVEEIDWIGGQMAAAAVTSMDEEGLYMKFPVRERGLYRDFIESLVNDYYTRSKDPFRAYYAWPEQAEPGGEPRVARAVLYAFIAEVRKHGTLDLATGTRVISVQKKGDTVTGVTLEKDGQKKAVASQILIEATEYGDLLPLAGARYRAGTVTSENLTPEAPVQADTYTAVIREYPQGVPEHLKITQAPPGYDPKHFLNVQLAGRVVWGSAGIDYKGPRSYRVLLAWRGMADSASPATGIASQERHTRCGLNSGRQDYPMNVASLEDPATRSAGQRGGIYRTFGELYYLQHELGLPWGLAEDEGYETPGHERRMAALELRADLAPMAKYLPQMPYVRESRRGRGIYTLRTADLGRFEKARLFENAVAMGDYFMDLDHGVTGAALEADLDPAPPPRGGGPFQVPFEVFIPEKLDGFLFAEKNISQSRVVNGATRLQPVSMLTGQAAGAIAGLSVREQVAPRKLNPIHVQTVLLAAGSNLIQRWYNDVEWATPLWQATQLLALHGVMDAPGPFSKDPKLPMAGTNEWRVNDPIEQATVERARARLAELTGGPVPEMNGPSRREFALSAAEFLKLHGQPPLLHDP